MPKFYIAILITVLTILPISAKHQHLEAEYQQLWCSAHNGVIEYELSDKTRVDCLTDTHAIEFDFAQKVYESIGQALYYSLMTNKKAGIVLILEQPEKEQKYLRRLKKVAECYNIDYWLMYLDDLQKKE